MLGHYKAAPEDVEQWGWRTDIEIINDDEVIIRAFNILPSGEEAKALETVYKRVKK